MLPRHVRRAPSAPSLACTAANNVFIRDNFFARADDRQVEWQLLDLSADHRADRAMARTSSPAKRSPRRSVARTLPSTPTRCHRYQIRRGITKASTPTQDAFCRRFLTRQVAIARAARRARAERNVPVSIRRVSPDRERFCLDVVVLCDRPRLLVKFQHASGREHSIVFETGAQHPETHEELLRSQPLNLDLPLDFVIRRNIARKSWRSHIGSVVPANAQRSRCPTARHPCDLHTFTPAPRPTRHHADRGHLVPDFEPITASGH